MTELLWISPIKHKQTHTHALLLLLLPSSLTLRYPESRDLSQKHAISLPFSPSFVLSKASSESKTTGRNKKKRSHHLSNLKPSPLALPTMDSFAMLHYWRAAAAASKPCTTIVSSILRSSDEDDDGDDDEDGPFIDLEFSIPNVESSEMQPKPQVSTSLLKSATKLRIFTLGSKKIKTLSLEPDAAAAAAAAAIAASSKPQQSRKLFVGFRAEDAPLASLFTRDNSSKPTTAAAAAGEAAEEDKKFSKEVLQRYLNKIKRLRFSDGQRAPHRRLGKSRSAVAAVRSPPRRRDDSLLQQEDGIQSAIAHCKRSFNAERGMESPPVSPTVIPAKGS